jgi:hypothetical protein
MRWILQWLLDDLRRILGVPLDREREVRETALRLQGREAWHDELLAAARAEAEVLRERVTRLERAEDTPGHELVQARRALVLVEADIRHHTARLRQAREALAELRAEQAEADPEWKMPWTRDDRD